VAAKSAKKASTDSKSIQVGDPQAAGDIEGFRIAVGPPRLVTLEFRAEPHESEPESSFQMHLHAERTAEDTVKAVMKLEVSTEDDSVAILVQYAVPVRVIPSDVSEDFNYELHLKDVVARVGPVVLYPYIRETVSSLTQKALLPPVILPVLNMGVIFDVDEVNLPPFNAEDTARQDPNEQERPA
jgi:preprotein translocase subunit SecB